MKKQFSIEQAPLPKLTKQREAVLTVVRANDAHLTASEIYALAGAKLPGISYATVYNSLRFLTTAGLIDELTFGAGASRFDRRTDRHDHAICTACGTLADFEVEEISGLMQMAARRSKFKAESLHLTLYGL